VPNMRWEGPGRHLMKDSIVYLPLLPFSSFGNNGFPQYLIPL
jgi:hypothetical protein